MQRARPGSAQTTPFAGMTNASGVSVDMPDQTSGAPEKLRDRKAGIAPDEKPKPKRRRGVT